MKYAQKCGEIGIQFVPIAFKFFGGFSDFVQKTLKRIDLLADNRNFQPAGLSIAYNRFSQGVSMTLMRASARMLISRDPLLRDSLVRQHPQLHNGYFTVLAHPILVIAVREPVCHPMSGDIAHLFRSTRLCGLMMTKF